MRSIVSVTNMLLGFAGIIATIVGLVVLRAWLPLTAKPETQIDDDVRALRTQAIVVMWRIFGGIILSEWALEAVFNSVATFRNMPLAERYLALGTATGPVLFFDFACIIVGPALVIAWLAPDDATRA